MKTVKILLVSALAVMLTTGAVAQEKQKKGKGGKAVPLNPVGQVMVRLAKLHDTLETMDLTEEQKGKIKETHEAVQPKMQDVTKKITEILGEEKMKQVGEISAKGKEAGKTPRQVATEIEVALKLTDEQNQKLAKVAEDLKAVQRELMKQINGILTPEQKEKLTKAMNPGTGSGKKKKQ